MIQHVTPRSLIGKAGNAYAQSRRQARRKGAAMPPKVIPGLGKVVTLGGNQAVILQTVDGAVVGYINVPKYRLVRLSQAQLAPYRNGTVPTGQHEALTSLIAQVLDRLACIEQAAAAFEARERKAVEGAHVNGNGRVHVHGNGNGDLFTAAE
jgi:hypothetical protein